jgi:hypothetical protein
MISVRKIYQNKYFFIGEQRYFFVESQRKKFAIPDKCPHRGGPLSLGVLCKEMKMIQCPWHDNYFRISFLIKNALPAMRIRNDVYLLSENEYDSSTQF